MKNFDKLSKSKLKTTPDLKKIINKESDDMKSELNKGLMDIKNRDRALNSKKIIDNNKLKETKIRLIRELFKMMESLGVDPNDLESINAFLARLDEQNPDLRELFEVAFNNLTSDQSIMPQITPPTENFQNSGMMNKFRNLAPETFRPQ